MKFTIDRSKWRCGGCERIGLPCRSQRGLGRTMLRNDQGFMCCLGQVCVQLGVSENALDWADPYKVAEETNEVFPLLAEYNPAYDDDPVDEDEYMNSDLAGEAICINDSEILSDKERETKLADVFRRHGHELEFVGEYAIPQ